MLLDVVMLKSKRLKILLAIIMYELSISHNPFFMHKRTSMVSLGFELLQLVIEPTPSEEQ
jgi:hypothetical protein